MSLFRGIIAAFILLLPEAALLGADRITAPVDAARTVVLKGNVRPEATAQNDQGAVDPGMEIQYATLLLTLDPSIESFLADQQTPGSANYRRWLTPEQFGDRFGLSRSDLSKVTAWLRSQGLRINDVARGRHWITFSGTADQMGRALHTEFHRYVVNGERHFANATNPSIPEALQGVAGGFRGLNDFRPQSMAVKSPKQPDSIGPKYNGGSNHFLAPDDLATMFDITALYNAGINGAGITLVIAGETDVNMTDFRIFQARYGISSNLPKLMLFGPDPGTQSDLIEADLDLEWSTAVARGANIVYAYATDVFTAAQYAADQNLGQMMSISYGDCEIYNSTAYRAVAQEANAEGMTLFVSSGDAGAATCDRNGPVPLATHGATASWPSSFPEITSVGGTELNDSGGSYWASTNGPTDASAQSYIPEVPWNDALISNALEAGGGAPSVLFAKPAWQTGPGVPNDGARDLPDVSLPASPYRYAYLVESGGMLVAVGGTSASSPSWAGIAALLNQYLLQKGTIAQPGLGNINPALYRLAQATTDVFHDVNTGNNAVPCEQSSPDCVDGMVGFAAGPGYDLATGLGSVDVFHFVMEWSSGTASATTLTAQPTTAGLNDTVQMTATVTGGGSGIAPTGNVNFIENDVNLGTATLAPSGGGMSTATLELTGNEIAVGNETVTALYAGDGVYTGSQGAAAVAINIPSTSGSYVIPWVTPNPVVQAGADSWPYTLSLTEKNGVATTVTAFTINGVNNLSGLSTKNIPANGTIRASLAGGGLVVPLNRVFAFKGQDGNGAAWSQSITVPFVGPAGGTAPLNPAISFTTTTPSVFENSSDAACPWAQQLTVEETGGYEMVLTRLSANVNTFTDFTLQLPLVFGTTRLAPYGVLAGTLCLSGVSAPATQTFTLTASISDGGLGGSLAAATTSNIVAASANPPFSVAPQTVALAVTDSAPSASATVTVQNGGGSWSAAVLPANRATTWLTLTGVNPATGVGSGPLTIAASGAGLSPGVYNATVVVTSGQIPVTIPVTLVVDLSSSTTIAAVANNFSGSTTAAPGEMVAVYGTAMAAEGVSSIASSLPLPFTLNGVSATVNGVSAPLYYVSPGQIDLQIPYETGAGTAVVGLNNNGQIAWFPIQVASAAPGLYPAAIDALSGALTTTVAPNQLLILYTTGEGDVTPTLATGATPTAQKNPANYPTPRQAVSVTIGGVPAAVAFAGITNGIVAEMQINITVPANAPSGTQPVVVTVGSAQSQPLMVTVGSGN